MPGSTGRCSLCGLPLPKEPVIRLIEGEETRFCCEGCARVYEVARDSGLLEQVLASAQPAGRKMAASQAPPARPTLLQHRESAFFDIEGMWCAGCALAAERVLLNNPGVRDASVSFAAERGRIEYDPRQADPQALMKALAPLGYRARITSSKEEQKKQRIQNRLDLQLAAAIAFGMVIMELYLVQLYPLYARGLYDSFEARRIQYLVWAMCTPVVFYGGLTFLAGAWRSLRARTVGMDTLVAIGVLSSYLYSAYAALTGRGETYFDSASMIVDFILIGRYLESAGGARARKDLRSLLRLQPDYAWRRNESGEGWQQVRAETLAVGETILVKPGERVPADGDVMEGEATVDEALLTGESMPVTKTHGGRVYAGTILREGALTCIVTRAPGKTRLSQITQLVSETLSQKPRIQRLADRASTILAYTILLLAALTFSGWFLVSHSAARAVMAAVAVLVVACPCALGLATPLAMTVTMGHAARNGILVRTPEAMETSAAIRRMVFDKTGTLTRGRLVVVESLPVEGAGFDGDYLLRLAASVEQYSEHPLARAIVQASPAPPFAAHDFFSVRGAGASALVETGPAAQRISVGSARLINPAREPRLAQHAGRSAATGVTVVWVDCDGSLAGYISVRDEPSPTAREALQRLHRLGIDTIMLSGDSPLAAQAIAAELGISAFEGNCSPEDKAAKIVGWQAEGLRVGMVGDGVNDAPALAQANLSITVAGGTDIAGQASDVVLTRSNLSLIPWFFQLSRRTRQTIIQNLGWAFAYNVVAVPLAVMGKIDPVIAAVAMAISSILVVVNSLRLRRL